MSVQLHLATENPDRPRPIVWRPWFVLIAILAGVLLGVVVMVATDFAPTPVSDPFQIIVRP